MAFVVLYYKLSRFFFLRSYFGLFILVIWTVVITVYRGEVCHLICSRFHSWPSEECSIQSTIYFLCGSESWPNTVHNCTREMTFDTKTLISIANKMIKSGTEFRKWIMCMINYLLCRSRYFLIIKCGVWNRFSIDSFSFSFSHNFGRLKCYYVLSLECVKNKNIIRKSTVIVGFSVFGYCKQNVWNKEMFAIGFDHLLYFISCVYLTLSLSRFFSVVVLFH